MTDFKTSRTKENLMRAFAGESQARNRYTFAADVAKKEGYPILHDLFIYTRTFGFWKSIVYVCFC